MRYFVKQIILFISGFIILCLFAIVPYYIADPYSDFGGKDNYSWKYGFESLGDIATKKLLASSRNPNSFIFGSSRTVSLYACYVEKLLPESRFFHYGSWNETIGGIHRKLELIDTLGLDVDNVIFYFDTDYTFKNDGNCLDAEHYLLTKKSKVDYLINHFRVFFKNLTIGKMKILLGQPISPEFPNWTSDLETNDSKHNCSDMSVITNYSKIKNSNTYQIKVDSLIKRGFYYRRSSTQKYKALQISEQEKEMLVQIKRLLKKHNAQYQIVLTPLYDQYKFSPIDNETLSDIFGDKIIDYSGINSITNKPSNYPDLLHFQHYISKNIIDSILIKNAQQTLKNQ